MNLHTYFDSWQPRRISISSSPSCRSVQTSSSTSPNGGTYTRWHYPEGDIQCTAIGKLFEEVPAQAMAEPSQVEACQL